MKQSFTIHDLPVSERPRERLQKFGVEALSAQEVLALILGRGIASDSVMTTAQRLLSQFENLREIAGASVEELSRVRGIGLAKASQIKAAFELASCLVGCAEISRRASLKTPEDIASLIRGRLGFVITQSVFKTAGAGQGFRRFMLGDSTPVKVLQVDDVVELNPFEGASNRTSVVVLEKGKPTTYPVQYIYWKKTARGKSIGFDSELADVMSITKRLIFSAEPVDAKNKTFAWLTGRPLAIKAIKDVLRKSDYQAREGVNTGGANGAYWLEIIERLPGGLVRVLNITEGQRRRVLSTSAVIEADLLYPLLQGRDVKRWQADPKAWILITHLPEMKLKAISEEEMQLQYEKTYHYLKQFEDVLKQRVAYKRYFREDAPFYSMFNVGTYTFALYKVVWARVGFSIEATVVAHEIIPQETFSLIATKTNEEVHYLCAFLNSRPFNFAAISYSQAGGKSFGAPHILQNIRIPKFNPQDSLHLRLVELSEKAHELVKRNESKVLSNIEEEIDQRAAELWDITKTELEEIKRCLAEIG